MKKILTAFVFAAFFSGCVTKKTHKQASEFERIEEKKDSVYKLSKIDSELNFIKIGFKSDSIVIVGEKTTIYKPSLKKSVKSNKNTVTVDSVAVMVDKNIEKQKSSLTNEQIKTNSPQWFNVMLNCFIIVLLIMGARFIIKNTSN